MASESASRQQPLCIEIPGVPVPVLPYVTLLGKDRFEVQRYSQNPQSRFNIIEDSRHIYRIATALEPARPDYSSLMYHGMNGRLLAGKKVSEDAMHAAFKRLDEDIRRHYVWAEFMDVAPQKRGHLLPPGKDVAIYRGAKVHGRTVDASGIKPVFLTLPKSDETITPEWQEAMGTGPKVSHWPAEPDYVRENSNGLDALCWGFGVGELPVLGSSWGANVRNAGRGALLGSKLSADEIVAIL